MDKVAEVSKKRFRIRDSYGVEIEPGQDDGVILAITVAASSSPKQRPDIEAGWRLSLNPEGSAFYSLAASR